MNFIVKFGSQLQQNKLKQAIMPTTLEKTQQKLTQSLANSSLTKSYFSQNQNQYTLTSQFKISNNQTFKIHLQKRHQNLNLITSSKFQSENLNKNTFAKFQKKQNKLMSTYKNQKQMKFSINVKTSNANGIMTLFTISNKSSFKQFIPNSSSNNIMKDFFKNRKFQLNQKSVAWMTGLTSSLISSMQNIQFEQPFFNSQQFKQLHYTQGGQFKIRETETFIKDKYENQVIRQKVLVQLEQNLDEGAIKHLLACEAMMNELYDFLKFNGAEIPEEKDEWLLAGLLHDDQFVTNPISKNQAFSLIQSLEKEGVFLPASTKKCVSAHLHVNGLTPSTPMEFSLNCSDGIIQIVFEILKKYPQKTLKALHPETVLDHIDDYNFAPHISRDDIRKIEERFGVKTRRITDAVLFSMKKIQTNLGLNK